LIIEYHSAQAVFLAGMQKQNPGNVMMSIIKKYVSDIPFKVYTHGWDLSNEIVFGELDL